ncbi:MAG: succinylglutamate desuccinylase/aspartoacylase family protein [Candidatus Eisenbacteria bacterium]
MTDRRQWPRVIAHVRGDAPGPMLIVLGGIHGNEPAGLLAARALLDGDAPPIERGDLVVLAGNRAALALGVRYQARDLNRDWSDRALAALPESGGTPEDHEQRELWTAIDGLLNRARGPAYFLDLHTTSAAGHPFVVVGDDPAHRAFAHAFGLPVFLGLVGTLHGALTPYLCAKHAATAIAIEGGQHDDPAAVARHGAVLRVALVECGLLPASSLGAADAPDGPRALLERARMDLPHEIRIVSRYAITPEDGFRMEPGFANIHPVRAGMLLARDRHGEIRAPEDGLVVMPLYQGLGDEGFFLGQAVGS